MYRNDYRPAGTGGLTPLGRGQRNATDACSTVGVCLLEARTAFRSGLWSSSSSISRSSSASASICEAQSNTAEDFFMAGREMTAWVAGLSFLSANLGALELMGWAGSAYQYGILATHWYWIGAIPAMLFLALVMMPFYYISKTHSVPGYLQLRFGESSRALSAVSFAFMTVLMSGVNMFAMAKVMQIVLGWDINFSIWVSSLTVGVYVALGGLRSAIFNEVLQFFLIWAGALLIPILGLYEAGGWANLKVQIAAGASDQYVHLWSTLGSFRPTRWASTGSESSSASAP